MMSTFRFTDNEQRNISSYFQVNKYGIAVFITNIQYALYTPKFF